METGKILICSLTRSVGSPQPDPFAFCVILPLPEERVKLQGAEHHISLPSTTDSQDQPLSVDHTRRGSYLAPPGAVAKPSPPYRSHRDLQCSPVCWFLLPLPLSLRASIRSGKLCCGGSGSCNAAERKRRELEGRGRSIWRVPRHVDVLACVTSVFSSLCPLPGFCLQEQRTEHFRPAGERRLAPWPERRILWGGRMNSTRLLFSQTWICPCFPPPQEARGSFTS